MKPYTFATAAAAFIASMDPSSMDDLDREAKLERIRRCVVVYGGMKCEVCRMEWPRKWPRDGVPGNRAKRVRFQELPDGRKACGWCTDRIERGQEIRTTGGVVVVPAREGHGDA